MADQPGHKRGRFLTFEGGEGAGKTTQIKALADHLQSQGISVTITREPGGSVGAEVIRQLLVTGDADRWSSMTEFLLVMAARTDHLQKTILPALERGEWVLCDRFIDSTLAYQGAAGGLGVEHLKDLMGQMLPNESEPDLTFILDLPIEVGLGRAGARGDDETRFEGKGESYHQTLRQAFLDIAKAGPQRCHVIDGNKQQGEVFADILAATEGLL